LGLSELEQELEIPKGKKKLKKKSLKKSGGGGDGAPDISAEFALAGSSAFAASAGNAGSSYKSWSGGESPPKLEKAISNKRAKLQGGKRKSTSNPRKGGKRKKKNNADSEGADESNSIFLDSVCSS